MAAAVDMYLMMFVAVMGVSGSSPTPPQLAAMDTVSERLFGYYLKFSLCNQAASCDNGGCSSTCNDSLVFSKMLQENGSWPDINYGSKQRSQWDTAEHLERTVSLLRSYHCAHCDKQAGSPPLLASVHSALDFWLQNDFRNPNWWCVGILPSCG